MCFIETSGRYNALIIQKLTFHPKIKVGAGMTARRIILVAK
jgi:hypothetical protein